MDTFDKVMLTVIILFTFVLASIGAYGVCSLDNRTYELEKRILVLETKLQLYTGEVCTNG